MAVVPSVDAAPACPTGGPARLVAVATAAPRRRPSGGHSPACPFGVRRRVFRGGLFVVIAGVTSTRPRPASVPETAAETPSGPPVVSAVPPVGRPPWKEVQVVTKAETEASLVAKAVLVASPETLPVGVATPVVVARPPDEGHQDHAGLGPPLATTVTTALVEAADIGLDTCATQAAQVVVALVAAMANGAVAPPAPTVVAAPTGVLATVTGLGAVATVVAVGTAPALARPAPVGRPTRPAVALVAVAVAGLGVALVGPVVEVVVVQGLGLPTETVGAVEAAAGQVILATRVARPVAFQEEVATPSGPEAVGVVATVVPPCPRRPLADTEAGGDVPVVDRPALATGLAACRVAVTDAANATPTTRPAGAAVPARLLATGVALVAAVALAGLPAGTVGLGRRTAATMGKVVAPGPSGLRLAVGLGPAFLAGLGRPCLFED